MPEQASLIMLQFLAWVADRPRTYPETMDAWRSTCPTTCAWEDAVSDDLVRRTAEGRLVLTDSGRARLAGRSLHPRPVKDGKGALFVAWGLGAF